MDKDEAAAVWAEAHTDAGRPDPAVELAQLEAAVYSRAGSAESVVDFIDPDTGETVRATPSELRLRALRATRLREAGLDGHDRFAGAPAPDAASTDSLDIPTTPHGLTGPPRRRFVLPLVAAAAFAAGIVTVLIGTSVLAPIDVPGAPVANAGAAPLLIFDIPSRFPDVAVPDLGDQFAAGSLRNVSGTSLAGQGFGVYLGRETGTGLYCLIVHPEDVVTAFSCKTADDVAQRGLVVGTAVTVRSPVTYDGILGNNELTAELSPRGDFSMSLSPADRQPIDPPTTTGTPLGTWTSEPEANGDFQGTLDASGAGLEVALDCVGEGAVTVDLGDDESSVFQCRHARQRVDLGLTWRIAWGTGDDRGIVGDSGIGKAGLVPFAVGPLPPS
ncbi:hypothetical protein [Cryobacterium tagatosivorans]|uniref:Uncharacterized protein n=1 Tax=Cryobacterium tagatosivorans TaxID=1259199 RepID=A0A4R8UH33_9MICO|nr:hypothetical protein [Cryobacterium tagatosivorans]TFB51315.1 hypothetical protein E3O23_08330 [Cryobacterium tagatosivorans]